MFFFEGKIELYNILFLLVIPIAVPVLMYFIKRKLLWISPLAAIIIGLGLTAVFYPYVFTDLFVGSDEIGGGSWLVFVLPVHCVVAVVATAILYAVSRVVRHYGKKVKYLDCIITVESPTKGTMRVRVEQRDFHTVRYTLLDGISAGYGFSSTRMGFKSKGNGGALPPISQEEIYNAAKDFIEQLGPSGYLDDGP